jgi:hypothetical protein
MAATSLQLTWLGWKPHRTSPPSACRRDGRARAQRARSHPPAWGSAPPRSSTYPASATYIRSVPRNSCATWFTCGPSARQYSPSTLAPARVRAAAARAAAAHARARLAGPGEGAGAVRTSQATREVGSACVGKEEGAPTPARARSRSERGGAPPAARPLSARTQARMHRVRSSWPRLTPRARTRLLASPLPAAAARPPPCGSQGAGRAGQQRACDARAPARTTLLCGPAARGAMRRRGGGPGEGPPPCWALP